MHLSRSRSIRLALLLAAAGFAHPLEARSLVSTGAVWKYHFGAPPERGWRGADYDDSAWKSGPAPLGYGEDRLGTRLGSEANEGSRPITTYFRTSFPSPKLMAGETLVVMLCVDDGAVVYLNGVELSRTNMQPGSVRPDTPALKTLGNSDEGFYVRIPIRAAALRSANNVLAVEVHQSSPRSSDLFFDLALKTVPPPRADEDLSDEASKVIRLFNERHYVGPGVRIPNGYLDGGRRMALDSAGHAESKREILVVDRQDDPKLALDLAFARSAKLRALPPLDRAQQLAARIHAESTPPGGMRWVGETTEQLQSEFSNRPILIGDWIDQCQAGVCRHRALLFKILADEAGLDVALVRGNYARRGPPGAAHAWNEIFLDDGRRLLIDVTHHGGEAKFPSVTDPEVVARYRKVDGTPWYTAAGG